MLVKIEFNQTVKYSKEIELTKEEYEIIKDLDNEDVQMYIRKDGKLTSNPQYEVLERIVSPVDIEDVDAEFCDVFVDYL